MFFVLYAKRLIFGVLGLGVYILAFVFAVRGDWVGPSFVETHAWIVAALIPMGAAYVFRRALAEGILTEQHTGAAVLIWAGFATAYFALLADSGMPLSEMPSAFIALTASLSLVPLAAVALAPWSLGLIRHR